MSQSLLRAGAVAGLAAAVVAAPAAASAAPAHHLPSHAGKHAHPSKSKHTRPAKPQHGTHSHHPEVTKAFVHGLVVSRQGDQLVVLAHTAKIGQRAVHNQVEHLSLAATAGSAAASSAARTVQAGYQISARGQEDNGEIVDATVQASTPLPAEVVMGTIDAVNGNLVSICALDSADGSQGGPDDNGGDQGDGDQGGGGGDQGGDGTASQALVTSSDDQGGSSGCSGEDSQGEALTADLTAATFSGAATSPADLTVGQYVVTLGEQNTGVFTAADVVAYSSEPAFVVGQVTAADQSSNSLTVTADDGDANEDTSGAGTPVDTSAALVVVNGAADGSYPAAGDEALVVGPDGSAATAQPGAPLAASLVYDFNANDTQPADDNGGDDNGDGSGD